MSQPKKFVGALQPFGPFANLGDKGWESIYHYVKQNFLVRLQDALLLVLIYIVGFTEIYAGFEIGYVCNILHNHFEIKITVETLKQLINSLTMYQVILDENEKECIFPLFFWDFICTRKMHEHVLCRKIHLLSEFNQEIRNFIMFGGIFHHFLLCFYGVFNVSWYCEHGILRKFAKQ